MFILLFYSHPFETILFYMYISCSILCFWNQRHIGEVTLAWVVMQSALSVLLKDTSGRPSLDSNPGSLDPKFVALPTELTGSTTFIITSCIIIYWYKLLIFVFISSRLHHWFCRTGIGKYPLFHPFILCLHVGPVGSVGRAADLRSLGFLVRASSATAGCVLGQDTCPHCSTAGRRCFAYVICGAEFKSRVSHIYTYKLYAPERGITKKINKKFVSYCSIVIPPLMFWKTDQNLNCIIGVKVLNSIKG